MTGNMPKTCKEITQDNVTAKHKTVSIMRPSFQISHNKGQDCKTEGKKNSACCQINVSQPVVLGLIYGGPQILVNVTYVLPYMEKVVQL
jgi:hypothetical protein